MNISVRCLIGLSICLFITLAGCALKRHQFILLEKRDAQIKTFLQYFHYAKALDPKGFHQLYRQEEEALFDQDNHDSIVRLALLSVLQDTTFQTTPRAIDLLQSYLYESSPDGEKRQFAAFLLHTLSQNQYWALNHKITKEKLNTALKERDELFSRHQQTKIQLEHALSERHKQRTHHNKANQALLKEQRTVENLRKQIEQLKVIEKTLDQRKKDKSPAT